MKRNLFFELIRVGIGAQESLSDVPSEEMWAALFKLAKKQTIVGICFSGIEKLPAEQRPPRRLLMKWYSLTQRIENRNKLIDERTEQTTRYFRENGFRTWILKGQGIAKLYPAPERRQSGDIDVWTVPGPEMTHNSSGVTHIEDSRDIIYAFARKNDPEGKLRGVNYHHIHYHLFEDAEVEVHIYPSYMNNPFHNRQLHRFFEHYLPTENTTPTEAFNLVFILLHCFDHFLGHGVGLRQVMDYYFVLKDRMTEGKNRAEIDAEALYWIKKMGLLRFTGAMMWVMQRVFGMQRAEMLVEPDKKEGAFLLEEIRQTGNMGHHDERQWGSVATPVSRFFYNLRHDWHFISHYPQEVCWQPFFSIWMNINRIFWKMA